MGSMVMQLVDKLVNLGVRRLRCKFLCAMTLEKHWPLQSFHLRKPWARISPGISPPRRVRLGDFCQLEISLGSIVSFRLAWSTVETLPPTPHPTKTHRWIRSWSYAPSELLELRWSNLCENIDGAWRGHSQEPVLNSHPISTPSENAGTDPSLCCVNLLTHPVAGGKVLTLEVRQEYCPHTPQKSPLQQK